VRAILTVMGLALVSGSEYPFPDMVDEKL
jgi:hypothetical protein